MIHCKGACLVNTKNIPATFKKYKYKEKELARE